MASKLTILLVVAIVLAVVAVWVVHMLRQPALVDLQKRYVQTKTEAQRQEIAREIESYYLNLQTPDSLVRRVETEYQLMLQQAAKANGSSLAAEPAVAGTSPYPMESRLSELLEHATVARVKNTEEQFQSLIRQSQQIAGALSKVSGSDYWIGFVARVEQFDQQQAGAWLKAHQAEKLCRESYESEHRFEQAEQYGAFGLRLLRRAEDERLQLDLWQRLLWMLNHHRSYYQISHDLAGNHHAAASRIGYNLRAAGFAYLEAEALLPMGNERLAAKAYDNVLQVVREHADMPNAEWYKKNALLGKAGIFYDIGEFDSTLNICRQVEAGQPSDQDRILIGVFRWHIWRATAHYEEAEAELTQAAKYAEASKDTFNLIVCMNNFGAMFEELREYDVARDYYNRAYALFAPNSAEMNLRAIVLGNLADLAISQDDFARVEEIIAEVKSMLKDVQIPSRQARLLRNIGKMYLKTGKLEEAAHQLERAAAVYNDNGYVLEAAWSKVDLVDCLIAQGTRGYPKAKTLLGEIEEFARKTNDPERTIDAIGRIAMIEFREGRTVNAVQTSNHLLRNIDALSSRFDNFNRLRSYRQKVQDFLKHAVRYEIAMGRIDSAFVKLEYAKAYSMKTQVFGTAAELRYRNPNGMYLEVDTLKSRLGELTLLIDYFVAEDSLFAFVMNSRQLQLFRAPLDDKTTQAQIKALQQNLAATIDLFDHYDSNEITAHYDDAVSLCRQLYRNLLGWTELEALLKNTETLYLVPDEYLYEVPFSALATGEADKVAFLVQQVSCTQLPSASFLYRRDRTAHATATDRKVLLSVDYSFPEAAGFAAAVKTRFPYTTELQVGHNEVRKEEVITELTAELYDVFIFVGHGYANSKYPERGFLKLAVKIPEKTDEQFVELTLADLERIDWLQTELIMLIGCETAGGKIYRGSGIAGLQQGFLQLGAQNVIGNLWEVNASQAIPQSQDFLSSWAATDNPVTALRAAQVKAIDDLSHNNYYLKAHPYFWAGAIHLTTTNMN